MIRLPGICHKRKHDDDHTPKFSPPPHGGSPGGRREDSPLKRRHQDEMGLAEMCLSGYEMKTPPFKRGKFVDDSSPSTAW